MTFEVPTLTELGPVHDLTLQNKTFGAADGIQVNGQDVGVIVTS